MEPEWIRYETVMLIQKRLVAEFGGTTFLRDGVALKQVLETPKRLYKESEKKPTLSQLSACYAYSMIKASPFLNGNRRLSLILSELFLRLNNSSLAASQLEKYQLILKLGV